ncbi:MAG: hypothetical protein EOO08_12140 [Chitinophagaceae bacterium]|nr:MAG: hypothetical protein EOO08_12140 [Chitinophagaceae bacterium]
MKEGYEVITLSGKAVSKLGAPSSMLIASRCFSLYFNCQHLLIQLPPPARSFFDFLCEEMRADTNSVIIDNKLKELFIGRIRQITSKKVTLSIESVNKYVLRLKKLNLILRHEQQKGYYLINPKYAAKCSKKARLAMIKKMIEERAMFEKDLQGLLATGVDANSDGQSVSAKSGK